MPRAVCWVCAVACLLFDPGATLNGAPVINEFMAVNAMTLQDPSDNQYEDWIELYNPHPFPIDLSNWHLTDDLFNPIKWTFPLGTSIPAGGYLLVWADNESAQFGLHANFQLANAGEALGLSDSAGVFTESFVFGPQTADVSVGRWPNGVGQRYPMNQPTPESVNMLLHFISNLSTVAAPVGSQVTLTGAGYSTIPSENIVRFGGVQASVLNTSLTQLTVRVPVGATYAPVSVTINGRTAQSAEAFSTTFAEAGFVEGVAFDPYTGVTAGASQSGVVLADINGDGRLDLVVANQGNGNVSVFRATGSPGQLDANSFATPVNFSTIGAPNSLAAADIDGDGKLDLVTGDTSVSVVSVVRNTSAPNMISFEPARAATVNPGPHVGLAVGDIDRDGRLDIAVACYGTNTVSIFRNLSSPGDVSLAPPVDVIIGTPPYRVALGDLDGDNRLDLVTANPTGASLSILRNIGSPGGISTSSFAPKFDLAAGNSPFDVAVGDLDGDGRLDVAAAVSVNEVRAWRNLSAPGTLNASSFEPRVHYKVAQSPNELAFPWGIALGDLTGDGRPELITANYLTNALAVLRNTATPGVLDTNSFAPWERVTTGFGPFLVAVGDLDGDQRQDLVSAHTSGGQRSLLRNTLPFHCTSPPTGLVAWWTGDGTPNDIVGGHDGALVGGVSYAPGLVDGAFSFTEGGYVEVPHAPSLSFAPGSSMTVELWANRSEAYFPFHLFGKRDGCGGSVDWNYMIGIDSSLVDTPLNTWIHWAIVYDSSGIRLYTNASLYASWPGSTLGPENNVPLTLGTAGLCQGFTGLMDDVRIYNRALSTMEISAIHNAGNAGVCPPAPFITGVQGGGQVIRSPDKALYDYGETITLTAASDPYYQFLRWSDGNLSPMRQVLAGDLNNLVAVFTNTVPLETLSFKQWDRSFGGTAEDWFPVVRATSDGGFVVAGWTLSDADGNKTTDSCGSGQFVAWILKLDSSGTKQWEQTVGPPDGTFLVYDIRQTSDSGYVLGGTVLGDITPIEMNCGKTSANHGGIRDMWLVRLDTNGQRVWDASYGGTGVDYLSAILPLHDGGFLLAGGSDSPADGNKTSPNYGNYDAWLVRVDANGTKLWDRSYGGLGKDSGDALSAMSDGGFLVAGPSASEPSGAKASPNHGLNDMWVLRLDAHGHRLWDRALGGSLDDFMLSMVSTPDGGAVLTGYSESPISGTKTATPLGGADYWVVRIDDQGLPLWDRCFGGTGAYDWSYRLLAIDDGGVLVMGESDSETGGNKESPQFGESDGWAVRLDAYGEKQWESSLGGTHYDYIWSAAPAGPDAFLFAGGSSSAFTGNKSSPHYGNEDFWLTKWVERTAPVGTPVVLVDDLYYPGNTAQVNGLPQITLQTSLVNGLIRYTLDGSQPTLNSTLYSGPFVLNQNAIVRAIAREPQGDAIFEADPVQVDITLFVPVITTQPVSQTVLLGANVTFTVTASGAPNPTYEWRRNGLPLPGATGPTLLLANVQPSDAGAYTVVVLNALGRVTSQPATLTVNAPPAVTKHPQDVTTTAGSAALFAVEVKGTPPFFYQWRHNQINLPGQTDAALVLDNVQPSQAGAYDCFVQNDYGNAHSAAANLVVLFPASILSQPPATTNLTAGSPVTVCVTAGGSDPIRYQWRKNGVNIPGATEACYSIQSVQPADSGAYTVVVANDAGATTSDPFLLNVSLPNLVAGDNFADRITFSVNVFKGSNVGATKEPGEPDHAGQAGGRSVWYKRQPGADGIVTLRTSGSQFDTLLAVYQGQDLDNLEFVASDEDHAGFFSSEVRFAASSNITYHVAVDGFDAAAGSFVITWELMPTPNPLPIITVPPASLTVAPGAEALFSVTVDDPQVNYQWFFNGGPLAGANANVLVRSNVDESLLGSYFVRVTNQFGLWAESLPAVLEIGPESAIQSLDKVSNPTFNPIENGLTTTSGKPEGLAAGTPSWVAALTGSPGAILVGAGTTDSQIFNNTDSNNQIGEPNHCGQLGGSTRWLILRAAVDGLDFVLDTEGSLVDTILAVYTRAGFASPLVEVTCAKGPGTNSMVQFVAAANTDYWVAVDGVNGDEGIVHLNWRLGALPDSIETTATSTTTPLGGSIYWTVSTPDAIPDPVFQWRRDGLNIEGATQASLSLFDITPLQAGAYSVVISNVMGMTEQYVATLSVDDSRSVALFEGFDLHDGGWQWWDGVATSTPVWLESGGAPGGHVSNNDPTGGADWYWSAPVAWLGNQSAAYGGAIEFDLWHSVSGTLLGGPDVILLHAGVPLVFDSPREPGIGWYHWIVPLEETAGWRVNDLGGAAATRDAMIGALASVQAWLIRGDYFLEPGGSALDNLTLVAPTETDVALLTATMMEPNLLLLAWPENASGFQLEAASSIEPSTAWTPMSTVPVLADGEKQVTITPAPTVQFYRLAKP